MEALPSLAIPHIPDGQTQLQCGGLYWISLDREMDALLLAQQTLANLPASAHAQLIRAGETPQGIVEQLSAESGPKTIDLFTLLDADLPAAMDFLPQDLVRSTPPRHSLVILIIQAHKWPDKQLGSLAHCCQQIKATLESLDITLMVLSHGIHATLQSALQPLSQSLSGLIHLYPSETENEFRYQIHFWHGPHGVCSEVGFRLHRTPQGFVCHPEDTPLQRLSYFHLVQQEVLEEQPAPTQRWHVLTDPDHLLQQVRLGHAGTLILAISISQQVHPLAQKIHNLRKNHSKPLRIIIREMAPCLRYHDECFLLASGVNLVIPYGTPLSRFFSIIERLDDSASPVDWATVNSRFNPPPLRGLLSPADFFRTFEQMKNQLQGEVSYQLIRFIPKEELRMEHCLQQLSLRRSGDIACVLDNQLFCLFFACRQDQLEKTLSNVFQLPWDVLFSKYEILKEDAEVLNKDHFFSVNQIPTGLKLLEAEDAQQVSSSVISVACKPLQIEPVNLSNFN